MENFRERVLVIIAAVPRGKVVSYGQVAAAAGSPRAARQVGGILRALDPGQGVPWWRVINSEGFISIKGNWEATKEVQAELLRREGVAVGEDFTVDMGRYRYNP